MASAWYDGSQSQRRLSNDERQPCDNYQHNAAGSPAMNELLDRAQDIRELCFGPVGGVGATSIRSG
jgi:hypothetical protein